MNNTALQLRVEIFNLFNRANLGNPQSAVNNPNFGRVTGLLNGNEPPRLIQLGARSSF